jgi:hypothetical protein
VSYKRVKLESKSVTPDTAFRFNSKDLVNDVFYRHAKLQHEIP